MKATTSSTGQDRATDASDATPETTTTRPQTMRAIVARTYGDADVLQANEIDLPTIADDEVLVQVHAAGLDRGTWHLMTGRPYLMRILGFGFRAPKNPVPGLDVAGTVVAVGASVTRFAIGDAVFGIAASGSFAEYAAAREDKLAHKPAGLTFDEAAVMGVSAITAMQAVRDTARLDAGQRVLVIGASGGVGTYAVQIAKAAGAHVTGVCSTAKLDLVRSIGADHVLDYTRDAYLDGATHYDVIIDIGGNSSLSSLRRALAPRGTLVIVGGEEGGQVTGGFGRSLRAPLLSPFVSQRLTMLASKERCSSLEEVAELVETGHLTPVVDSTYPLHEVPAAMHHLEAGDVRGKVAIVVSGPR